MQTSGTRSFIDIKEVPWCHADPILWLSLLLQTAWLENLNRFLGFPERLEAPHIINSSHIIIAFSSWHCQLSHWGSSAQQYHHRGTICGLTAHPTDTTTQLHLVTHPQKGWPHITIYMATVLVTAAANFADNVNLWSLSSVTTTESCHLPRYRLQTAIHLQWPMIWCQPPASGNIPPLNEQSPSNWHLRNLLHLLWDHLHVTKLWWIVSW